MLSFIDRQQLPQMQRTMARNAPGLANTRWGMIMRRFLPKQGQQKYLTQASWAFPGLQDM